MTALTFAVLALACAVTAVGLMINDAIRGVVHERLHVQGRMVRWVSLNGTFGFGVAALVAVIA